MQRILQKLLIRKIFRKHRNSLPKSSNLSNPKMEYHALANGVFWEDEGLRKCHPDLENIFRFVINYRTNLITGALNSGDSNKHYFELAKKFFPNWIGFDQSRCSYDAELSDRVKRIRKVSDWKLDKLMKDD